MDAASALVAVRRLRLSSDADNVRLTNVCIIIIIIECWICNWEVAGSNLGRGYFIPRSTQPSIPPGSLNEYQLRLGMKRQV